jgi:hypothetical protein
VPPESSGSRTVPIVIGSILAVIGALLALAGGAVFAVFGSDGVLESSRNEISTPTTALVSEVATIEDTADAAKVLGSVKIRLSSSAKDVFIGVGPAADVDRYLQGAPIDKVTDVELDPFRLDTNRRDGSANPDPPADQSFWVARSEGGTVNWKVRDGDYRFVVMNADGSPDVTTDASFGVEIPGLPTIGIVVLVIGVLLLAGGLALVIVSARRR